jgi:hypothetical protein
VTDSMCCVTDVLQVVAETKGTEEYVHLKSKEDEYHHMESTMPQRGGEEEGPAGERGGPGAEGQGGGAPGPNEEGVACSEEEQAAMEAEYAEAYRLYHEKMAAEGRDASGEEVGGHPSDGYGNDRGAGFQAPFPRPRAFSHGHGSDEEEQRRAADAFAFMEGMEHLDGQDSPQALYGERVVVAEEEDVSEHPVQVATAAPAGSAGREYLFEPAEDDAAHPSAVNAPVMGRQSGEPAEAQAGSLSRCSSYESLHEID